MWTISTMYLWHAIGVALSALMKNTDKIMNKKKKRFFDTAKVGKVLKGSCRRIIAPGLVQTLEGVSSVGEAVSLINGSGLSAEEKQKLLDTIFTAQQVEEQELTKRHQADAMSDSWLSKNVRPLVLNMVYRYL